MKKVTFDHQTYIAPTWNEMGKLCFELAKSILKKNNTFHRLIALAKGGLTWSRSLADYMNIESVSVTHIRFYTDIEKTAKQPVIVQSLPVTVENEHILLFDDVADSGKTLQLAQNYLKMCGASSVKTATVFTKSWAKTKPDFTASTTEAWIIFPHEIREMVEQISKKWQNMYSKKEIIDRFTKLGLDREEVIFFLNHST